MTQATLDFSYWLSDNWIVMVSSFLVSIIGIVLFANTEKGKLFISSSQPSITSKNLLSLIAPYLIMGPGLFTGLITLGVMVQVSNAFARVHGGFALFLHNWTTITELRSIWRRLKEFEDNLKMYNKQMA